MRARHVHVVLAVRRHERLDTRVADDRPEVHVLIQLEPRAQEQVTLEDPGLHVGVADRAQEDRVHLSQTRELVVGKRVGRPQVTLSTQVEVDDLDVEPLDGAHGFEDLQAFAHDLRPGTVAGDHPDRVGHGMMSFAASAIWRTLPLVVGL